ncbi:DUF4174 domain-containing protein [Nostoc sp. DedQUE02]|nr:DUF4174 domain-containing protein [Nostoc sp. DedQUE03]MDZ7975705.1 DUF4174 domain-containing protein [Nostoc sp. DedQUE03]MDZ8048408.1 DUF4174 domain-containing protein [Nostoc sp. DedQUE02]
MSIRQYITRSIGKDGSVKRQDTKPVQATAIFEQIDAMPMRQQEMRSSR